MTIPSAAWSWAHIMGWKTPVKNRHGIWIDDTSDKVCYYINPDAPPCPCGAPDAETASTAPNPRGELAELRKKVARYQATLKSMLGDCLLWHDNGDMKCCTAEGMEEDMCVPCRAALVLAS